MLADTGGIHSAFRDGIHVEQISRFSGFICVASCSVHRYHPVKPRASGELSNLSKATFCDTQTPLDKRHLHPGSRSFSVGADHDQDQDGTRYNRFPFDFDRRGLTQPLGWAGLRRTGC